MPDVSIQPAGLPDYRVMGKIIPTYLVIIEKGKKESCFIATKFDDSYVHCGKFVGFFFEGTPEDAGERYEELIKTMDAKCFVEIMFPWNKIQSIRSLVYKHKVTGEKK